MLRTITHTHTYIHTCVVLIHMENHAINRFAKITELMWGQACLSMKFHNSNSIIVRSRQHPIMISILWLDKRIGWLDFVINLPRIFGILPMLTCVRSDTFVRNLEERKLPW